MAPCPARRNPAGIGVAQATQLAAAGVRVTVLAALVDARRLVRRPAPSAGSVRGKPARHPPAQDLDLLSEILAARWGAEGPAIPGSRDPRTRETQT